MIYLPEESKVIYESKGVKKEMVFDTSGLVQFETWATKCNFAEVSITAMNLLFATAQKSEDLISIYLSGRMISS
jgi:hypothetical protein